MESPRPNSTETISPVRKRVEEAFAILAQAGPARDPDQAREMFREAFQKVEENIPQKDRRLNLATPSDMPQVPYGNLRIRVSVYKSHILFLGEHGAIEVRLFPKEGEPSEEELVERHQSLTLVFEKSGSDGKLVWEH